VVQSGNGTEPYAVRRRGSTRLPSGARRWARPLVITIVMRYSGRGTCRRARLPKRGAVLSVP
jgi:hypothetical protein